MALPTYKDIMELFKKGATLEAQEKINELREEIVALRERNIDLLEKNKLLDAQLKQQREVEFDGITYWKRQDGSRIGPYCQRCFDVEKNFVRLQDYGDVWFCLACKVSHHKNI